jgi:hypothetical protein
MLPEWRAIAKLIGLPAFLAIWRLVDASDARRDGSMITLKLPPYSSWLRTQRNRYVKRLAASGVGRGIIADRVARDFGERLSDRTIDRICKGRGES